MNLHVSCSHHDILIPMWYRPKAGPCGPVYGIHGKPFEEEKLSNSILLRILSEAPSRDLPKEQLIDDKLKKRIDVFNRQLSMI